MNGYTEEQKEHLKVLRKSTKLRINTQDPLTLL